MVIRYYQDPPPPATAEPEYPPCWSVSYDEYNEACTRQCGKRMSCKAHYDEAKGINKPTPIVRQYQPPVRPPLSPMLRPQQVDVGNPHDGCAGIQPREGEEYWERLGKNVLAGVIRAVAYEFLEFFKRWQF
jgi:hypothetical protein